MYNARFVLFCGHRRSPPYSQYRKRTTTMAALNKKGVAYGYQATVHWTHFNWYSTKPDTYKPDTGLLRQRILKLGCTVRGSPYKDENGFAIYHTINIWVIVQKSFHGIKQSRWKFVNFIEDKERSLAQGHVTRYPRIKIFLNKVSIKHNNNANYRSLESALYHMLLKPRRSEMCMERSTRGSFSSPARPRFSTPGTTVLTLLYNGAIIQNISDELLHISEVNQNPRPLNT